MPFFIIKKSIVTLMREINIVIEKSVKYDGEINGRENGKTRNLQHQKSFRLLSTLIRYRLHALHSHGIKKGKLFQ